MPPKNAAKRSVRIFRDSLFVPILKFMFKTFLFFFSRISGDKCQGHCNFDSGLCGFKNSDRADFDWKVVSLSKLIQLDLRRALALLASRLSI